MIGSLTIELPSARGPVEFTEEQRRMLGDLSEPIVSSLAELCGKVRGRPVVQGEERRPPSPGARAKALRRLVEAVKELQSSIADLPPSDRATIGPGYEGGKQFEATLALILDHAEMKVEVYEFTAKTGRPLEQLKPLVVELIEDCLRPAGLPLATDGRFQRVVQVCFDVCCLGGGAKSSIQSVINRREKVNE